MKPNGGGAPTGALADKINTAFGGLDKFKEQFKQAEADHRIWENQRYVRNPPTVPEETEGYRLLRSWARRFYPGEAEYEHFVRSEVGELALP